MVVGSAVVDEESFAVRVVKGSDMAEGGSAVVEAEEGFAATELVEEESAMVPVEGSGVVVW